MLLKIFEKTQTVLLYWLDTQQQTSTFRKQKFNFFYEKCSAKFKQLSLKFKKQQEVTKNILKTK